MLNFIYEDVYDAIPTVVTTFVAIIAKISIFIFLLELVHYLSKSSFNYVWVNNLLISSLLSLVIGTVLGLNQSRIKRLYAYSTISHVGFILLGLSIHSVESIQAFMFYIVQYSFSNLNAFILLITIGYTYYNYTYKYDISDHNLNKTQPESAPQNDKEKTQLPEFGLKDKDNSPIQLISQLKGYYNINPLLALSLSITLFSFAGIPPLVGFFGKMMILSAAIDSGYIFMALIAILTSVISAVYYLYIINIIYFEKSEYTLFKNLNNMNFKGSIANIYFTGEDTDKKNGITQESILHPSLSTSLRVGHDEIKLNYNNVVLSNYLTITISILTLIILLFIFIPTELLNISSILVLILFKI